MMKITGLSHLFKWENLHNWWLTKYFFAPLYLPHYHTLNCRNDNTDDDILLGTFHILGLKTTALSMNLRWSGGTSCSSRKIPSSQVVIMSSTRMQMLFTNWYLVIMEIAIWCESSFIF